MKASGKSAKINFWKGVNIMRISCITRPQVANNILATLPKANPKAVAAKTMALILPAATFIKNTTQKLDEDYNSDDGFRKSEDYYIYRGGMRYRIHTPQDPSDYFYETPCPEPKKEYIPYS